MRLPELFLWMERIGYDDLRYINGLWVRSCIAAVPGYDINVDGVHPNDAGFMSMAAAIKPVLKKILG